MGHTGVLDGAVELEVAAEAALVTTIVDDADVEACSVAVVPVARVAAGVGVGVPGAFSFCARFVALPKPRNLPIIPPPGVPGVATPFPVAVPLPLPAPVFALVPDPLSSGMAGVAAAAAPPGPPLDTDGRRVGAGTSSFCATTFDVAAVVPPLAPPWTGCEARVVGSSLPLPGCAVVEAAARLGESCACGGDT
jgi:hypothetical protein